MDTPQILLEHHPKTLRLPTFLREYDKVAQQCSAEGVNFPRYLLRLSELELLDRERRNGTAHPPSQVRRGQNRTISGGGRGARAFHNGFLDPAILACSPALTVSTLADAP